MDAIVIDGNGKVLGRIASRIAKNLLSGKKVVVLNAEKVYISGHEKDIVSKYKQLVELKDKANPEHSPYFSRRPDLFVKRSIRGMLPFKKARGKAAYKLLRVYRGVPEDFKNAKVTKIESKDFKEIFENVMTIGNLVKKLGYEK